MMNYSKKKFLALFLAVTMIATCIGVVDHKVEAATVTASEAEITQKFIDRMVAEALARVGLEYANRDSGVDGGHGTNSDATKMDCTGLLNQVFNSLGVKASSRPSGTATADWYSYLKKLGNGAKISFTFVDTDGKEKTANFKLVTNTDVTDEMLEQAGTILFQYKANVDSPNVDNNGHVSIVLGTFADQVSDGTLWEAQNAL